VTESAQYFPLQQRSWAEGVRPPKVVYAAVVITLATAVGTALLAIPLTVIALSIAGPIADSFGEGSSETRWYVMGTGGGLVALSMIAGTLALCVLSGRAWARWLLIGLSCLAAIIGVIFGSYILPLMVTAVAVAVIVLLLMPTARAWPSTSRNPQTEIR
jgi:hypothetical protein